MLDAMLAASRRPHEILDIILEAADVPAATSAVTTLLQTSQQGSRAVVQMQWRRLTQEELRRLQAEIDDLRGQLAASAS